MNFVLLVALLVPMALAKPLIVGSKKFTESVTLGELLRLNLEAKGESAVHQKELGGTTILWNALKNGDIDVYPEYSGTILEEILRRPGLSEPEMKALLEKEGIGLSGPIGFNDTYAVGMREDLAKKLSITTISDLNKHPELRMGWASEFMERRDGWPGLRKAYNLTHKNVRGLDHDFAYRALQEKEIDVIDLYSTDAEIPYYSIRVLKDDLNFFPAYQALYLYRLEHATKLIPALSDLSHILTESEMSDLNRQVKLEKKSSAAVAAELLKRKRQVVSAVTELSLRERLFARTLEHVKLVSLSMLFAILFAVPMGIVAAKKKTAGKVILLLISSIQTVPALALLVLLIRPLTMIGLPGIGDIPALLALFLYSLLPIVRNTHAGLIQIPQSLKETGVVLNLPAKTRLLKIELPLALPMILAGIKTAMVINIGFATIGALIGAGGYGQSILTGIRLDNYALIMEGAIPAAIMAFLAQELFEVLEKRIVSRGLAER